MADQGDQFVPGKGCRPMAKTVKVNRSSVTGKFVTEKYADTHKSITETERIKK